MSLDEGLQLTAAEPRMNPGDAKRSRSEADSERDLSRSVSTDATHRPLAGSRPPTAAAYSVDEAALENEARRLARYLTDVETESAICTRYIAAARSLFAEDIDGDLAFVRRHPWALPFVDAITAIVRPRSQVRQRVLLMTALLETSPAHADFFLAPPPQRARLVLGLCANGLSSAGKLLGGAILLPFLPHHVARR